MAIDERLMKHARGAMIGLAIGDALGMPTQSMSAERIIECYGGPVRSLLRISLHIHCMARLRSR